MIVDVLFWNHILNKQTNKKIENDNGGFGGDGAVFYLIMILVLYSCIYF
jgi:hypothetical protein